LVCFPVYHPPCQFIGFSKLNRSLFRQKLSNLRQADLLYRAADSITSNLSIEIQAVSASVQKIKTGTPVAPCQAWSKQF
jgi:hypothetical protein